MQKSGARRREERAPTVSDCAQIPLAQSLALLHAQRVFVHAPASASAVASIGWPASNVPVSASLPPPLTSAPTSDPSSLAAAPSGAPRSGMSYVQPTHAATSADARTEAVRMRIV